jgi:hypothetical protein
VAQVSTSRDDVVDLSDFAWLRLRRRMDGLTDQEYLWEPVANCRSIRPRADGSYVWDGPAPIGDPRVFTTLAWRLCHIIDFLTQARNGPWLGLDVQGRSDAGVPETAAQALEALDNAYAVWGGLLAEVTDESFDEPIGNVGGPFASDTRRAFVLHILDELIHHGAEAALLRDLYRERQLEAT